MELPITSYIVLGMLSYREMSGYDLKQMMDKCIQHFYWSPAKSQIYMELRRLEQQGWATVTEVPQTHRPDKRLYCITPAGRNALQSWLNNAEIGPDIFKSPFLLRLFFGHLLSPESLITQVETRRQELLKDIEVCEEKEWDLRDRMQEPLAEANLLFPLLSLQFNMAMIRAALAWTDDALVQLQAWQGTSAKA